MIPVDTPGLELTIHEVLGGDADDLESLLTIHQDLFPQYGYYRPFMRERAQEPPDADPRFVEHWWLLRINGEAAAVRFFKYVPHRHCGCALAIGIKPEFRPYTLGRYRRFSEAILLGSIRQLKTDAKAAGRPTPVGMVTEIESYLRLRYYREYGYVRLPLDYLEPSFTPEAEPHLEEDERAEIKFRPIELGILPLAGSPFDLSDPRVLNDVVSALLIDHYGLDEDHWAVIRARKSIP